MTSASSLASSLKIGWVGTISSDGCIFSFLAGEITTSIDMFLHPKGKLKNFNEHIARMSFISDAMIGN
jgi:hypothetical protein